MFHTCAKIKQSLPSLNGDISYDQFREVANDQDLLNACDNEIEVDDDLAHELAKELWLEVLANHTGDSDALENNELDNVALVSFKEYLQLIAASCKGFVFSFAVDDHGVANGVVWQTATMRSNFERFGGYISLDTMKRGINQCLWLYMSVVM